MRGQQIKELLEKYVNGTLTMGEEQLLDEWYITLGGADEIQLSPREITELKERIWKEVSAKTIDAERNDHIVVAKVCACRCCCGHDDLISVPLGVEVDQ